MKKYSEIKEILEAYENQSGASRSTSVWIDLNGVLQDLSYLFHDFKNIEVVYNQGTEEEYSKELSPLFYSGYIENPDYWEIFRTVVDDIPFYFKETSIEVADNPTKGGVSYKKTSLLPQNRDSGILDVPSPLQNSDFYQTWFRDVQGYVNNKLILDVFNKLNLSVINENCYLNFDLFVKYAEKVYNQNLVDTILLDFKQLEKYEGIERIGTQEYLDEIVEEKLATSKEIIYYSSDQADILSSWTDSLYNAGLMDQDKIQKEKLIYRLQDIKHELFRRKFAGSKTLYNLILKSVNRQGSLVAVAPAVNVGTDTAVLSVFNDKRSIRLISVPGVNSTYFDVDKFFNPLDVFYTTPLETKEGNLIPLDILIPLFYSSEAEGPLAGILSKEYASEAYRGNINTIQWDQMTSIDASQSILSVYPTLDERTHTPSEEGIEESVYLTLDSEVFKDSSDASSMLIPLTLDMRKPFASLTDITGNVFDISANKLLYHKNTLQAALDSQYPYLTYPLSNGTSICLMDLQWITYLEKAIQQKSRVQDETQIGVQFSDYVKLNLSYQKSEIPYFTIDYENETKETLMLYYNTLNVRLPNLIVPELPTPKLITKISLANKVLDACERVGQASQVDKEVIYDKLPDEFKNFNVGLLPFTYGFNTLTPEAIEALKYGLYAEENYYEEESEEAEKYVFFDDYAERDYVKAYFLFSDWDIVTGRNNRIQNSSGFLSSEPLALDDLLTAESSIKKYLTTSPTKNTRTIFYVIKRYLLDEKGEIQYVTDSNGNELDIPLYAYSWSDPIPVFWQKTIDSCFANNAIYRPDWWNLGIYFNPYLNFVTSSASPLRHNATIPSYQVKKEEGHLRLQEGATENTGLCNLARVRQYDKFCNDLPENELSEIYKTDMYSKGWIPIDETFTYTGTYLKHYRGKQAYIDALADQIAQGKINRLLINQDYIVSGDNRQLDVLDNANSSVRTSDLYYDTLGVNCINVSRADVIINSQNSKVLPAEDPEHPEYAEEYEVEHRSLPNRLWLEPGVVGKSWWWPNIRINSTTGGDSYGITACLNILAQPKEETEMTLLYQKLETGAISISLVNIQQEEEDHYTACIKFKAKDDEAVSERVDLRYNTRIGCSLYLNPFENQYSLCIAVNDSLTKVNISPTGSSSEIFESYKSNEPIYLFETADQENHFYGNLYDLRLYNDGLEDLNLLMLSRGTLRELFSYSPSIYKLSSAMYHNLAYSKEVNLRNETLDITHIRLLNRDLWDTIMVDPFPVFATEMDIHSIFYKERYFDPYTDTDVYKLITVKNPEDAYYTKKYTLEGNCIQQKLKNNVEVINSSAPLLDARYDCVLKFNGSAARIKETDAVSIIMSTLYPVTYERWPYISFNPATGNTPSLKLVDGYLSTTGGNGIFLPKDIVSADDNIEYSADLDLNFYVEPKFDLSKWYSHGINIDLSYNEGLGRTTAHLIQKEGSAITADNDHILIPFVIPRQKNLTSTQYGYIDRLRIKDFEICNEIKELLRVQNYYTELEIPLAYQEAASENKYARRWEALRTLKEGTYYFTCKYPIQIIPFLDVDINSLTSSGKFANLFATCRFKIVVKGTPKKYSASTGTSVAANYTSSRLASTLSDPGHLVDPEDNRTFPHRLVDIDLYVMDAPEPAGLYNVSYAEELKWTKLASNHDTTTGIIQLTKETLSRSTLAITSEIPLFLFKTYSTPFFVAEENSKSPKPDWIKPIFVNPLSDGALKDRLLVKTEQDLDFIVLTAGKTYKLLFEYTGKITELSYYDGSFENMEAELSKAAQLVNLLETPLYESEYCYTSSGRAYVDNTAVTGLKSGYKIGDDNSFTPITTAQNISGLTTFDFGDPYSRANSKNYLLTILSNAADSHRNIENSYTFTYQVEDPYPKSSGEAAYSLLTAVTAPRETSAYSSLVTVKINEASILKSLHSVLITRVQELLHGLKNKREGLFSELSEIAPNIIFYLPNYAKYSFIKSYNEDLVSYRASDRILPVSNRDILIERNALYSNNLLVSRNFMDSYYWKWNLATDTDGFISVSPVAEESQDKDVCRVLFISEEQQNNKAIELTYTPPSNMSVSSSYEIAILVSQENSTAVLSGIQAQLISGKTVTTLTLEEEEALSGGYRVFSKESEKVVASQIRFIFNFSSLPASPDSQEILRVATAIVRRKPSIYREYQGFSDSNTIDDEHKLHLFGHHIVMFKNRYTNIITPLQFDNRLFTVGHELSATVQREIVSGSSPVVTQNFIEANSLRPLTQYSPYTLLRKAWLRRMYLNHWYELENIDDQEVKISKTKATFRSYRIGKDQLGLKTLKISLESNDLYELCTKGDRDGIYFKTQESTRAQYFDISSRDGVGLRFRQFDDETLKILQHSNLKLDLFSPEQRYYYPPDVEIEDPYGLVSLENEKISLIVNSFNPDTVRAGETSPVAVTNVQLLSSSLENIISDDGSASSSEIAIINLEYEFLPIIYDETTQHLSMNMFVHFER